MNYAGQMHTSTEWCVCLYTIILKEKELFQVLVCDSLVSFLCLRRLLPSRKSD